MNSSGLVLVMLLGVIVTQVATRPHRHKRQTHTGGDSNHFDHSILNACRPLPAPADGQINCADSTIFYRCTAHCNSGYQFDNGDTTIQKDCDPMTGQFFDGPTFPKCILIDKTTQTTNSTSEVYKVLNACRPLPAPADGQINCTDSTIFYRCTAHCNSGYQFDNGDTTIQKECDPMTGQFFDGPNFPKCIPAGGGVSSPLVTGAQASCQALAAPTNGQINCGDSMPFYRCTAQCNSGYQFENGDTTIQKDCDSMTGQFFDGPTFPKCIPAGGGVSSTLVTGAAGGGVSNPFGPGAQGACKPLAAPRDGQINCGDSTIFYRCTAHCNSGYQFDNGNTTIQKDCDPITGMFFDGPTFPKCIPKCSPACQNGLTCVKPNICLCGTLQHG